jgi:hypothetical protein
MHLERH